MFLTGGCLITCLNFPWLADVVVRWLEPENGVIDAVRLPIDGSVTFSWTGQHDVWEIPSAQCPEEFANSTTMTQIAPQSTGGSVTVEFPEETVRYFACSARSTNSRSIEPSFIIQIR